MKNAIPKTTQPTKKIAEAIKLPILAPLFAAILLLLATFTLAIYRLQQHHLTDDVRVRLDSTRTFFDEHLAEDAQLLSAITHFLKNDPNLQNIWLAKDRNALLTLTAPIFEKLHQDYRITHLYFIDANNTCFLRVHNPPRFGDRIKRFTLNSAAKTGEPAWGIELGPYGTFTLRNVHPWFVNGSLTGFIELGEEIEHITPELKDIIGVDLVFLINKSFLTRQGWEEGLKMMGRSGNWDLIPNCVIADSTMPSVPPEFIKLAGLPHNEHKDQILSAKLDGSTYRGGFVELKDAAGRKVGDILIIKNVSKEQASLQMLLAVISTVCFLIASALVSFFYIHITGIEKRLIRAHASLATEIEKRKETEAELRKHRDNLEELVSTRTAELEETNKHLHKENAERKKAEEETRRSYDIQTVINRLLGLSLENIALRDMLERALDQILSIPWLSPDSKGAIFLIEDEPEVLVMKTQRGLSIPLQTMCARVPFGRCICGRAASSGEIAFADRVDGRHEHRFEGMSPHGHYCVPILSAGKVLGVINTYVSEGHRYDQKEEEFLRTVANVMAGIIERNKAQQRQTETLEQLEKTNRRLQQEAAQRTEAEKSLAKANDDLQFAVAQLSRSNRQLSEFAHLATHDLKTPLRGIGTLAEWLLDDYYDKFDEQGQKQIGLLVSRVRRMDNLINAVLQYSTIARNKQNEHQVDLNILVKAIIADFQPTPNITLTVNKNLPVLTCEEEQIRQVFYNLVANAVKFMDKPDGHITIDFEDEKYFWKFSVADNGPGIEPKHFERIFRLFQTLSDREEAESAGIGLTIAKKIVELYGGKIWLTSKLGAGSTFFFTLPKQPTAVACQSPQQAKT